MVAKIISAQKRTNLRQYQEELYGRYANKVYFKCYQIVQNRAIAKDLSHDVIVKVFCNLASFKMQASLYSWIMAITYNHCMSYIDKEKKNRIAETEHNRFRMTGAEIELEHKELLEIQLSQLEVFIEALPPEERLILLIRYQEGLSIKQISKNLNISESAVKMRLKRGRDKLAESLRRMDHGVK